MPVVLMLWFSESNPHYCLNERKISDKIVIIHHRRIWYPLFKKRQLQLSVVKGKWLIEEKMVGRMSQQKVNELTCFTTFFRV